MDNLKIGNYIQNLRKKAGLTQKDLADKLNISFQAVSKWETGESLPDTGILLDLADILGTSVDKLLCGGAVVAGLRTLSSALSTLRISAGASARTAPSIPA